MSGTVYRRDSLRSLRCNEGDVRTLPAPEIANAMLGHPNLDADLVHRRVSLLAPSESVGPSRSKQAEVSVHYQITVDTWRQHGGKMGLTDFSPMTQDLIAIEILRSVGVTDKIKAGDVVGAMGSAATKWAALPLGPGLGNRYPAQPHVPYETFFKSYQSAGGTGQ